MKVKELPEVIIPEVPCHELDILINLPWLSVAKTYRRILGLTRMLVKMYSFAH